MASLEIILPILLSVTTLVLSLWWHKSNLHKKAIAKVSFISDRGPLFLTMIVSAGLFSKLGTTFDANQTLGFVYLACALILIVFSIGGQSRLSKKHEHWTLDIKI